MKRFSLTPIAYAASVLLHAAFAQTAPAPATSLPDVVVTAPKMQAPLVVTTDPKAPRQPVPAHDGADYLKTIPGFSVIRKAGTDGDPVLRGMAGSRLNILLDGQHILGGCGGRMDPPTAYVFPEMYDSITVRKGPQTVLYGPVGSAGTVLFERKPKRFTEPTVKFNGSLMTGSAERYDGVADVTYGNRNLYLEAAATHSQSGDYEDGDGKEVHSRYKRWSGSAALGLTPDDNTLLELSMMRSDGEAAYADRMMDGSKFDRENIGFKFSKRNLSPLVEKLEAQLYRNYVDHVMDNYSLRTPPALLANYRLNNPDRTTSGGRIAATLRIAEASTLTVGTDLEKNDHTIRNGVNYRSQPRVEDANFRNAGIFGELAHTLGDQDRLFAGLRADRWRAEDPRAMAGGAANPTRDQTRKETLTSGFARYERDLGTSPVTVFAGIGRSERFPDYWELISKESATTTSAFNTKPEKTNQIDVGAIWQSDALHVSVSGFYNKIDDFIMVQSGVTKGMRTGLSTARNIDATTWGGEIGVAYSLNANWKVDSSLAYVRGNNDTDDKPLAQLPPLETRFGLNYDDRTWSAGALLRVVAEQDRFDRNQGNIAGQDIGRTAGFAIFSVNGGWKPKKGVQLTAGVDNLFDRIYAEHLSKGGFNMPGYTQTTRINEPGRTLWLKAQIALD
ncbi:MAG TPA: TonB-dependent copper receptor [Noviherbaspirillum sp.]|nr:TonB-dependent copper receptor [Noviherbaspirillum sp.]